MSEADEFPQKYCKAQTNNAVIQSPGTMVTPRNFDMIEEPRSGGGMSPYLVKVASIFNPALTRIFPPPEESI